MMKNTFGSSVAVTIFGESHGAEIGAVIDGLAPGIPVSKDFISSQLKLRRPYSSISTQRQEPDLFRIVSGVFNGMTTGSPICILIPNTRQSSEDYTANRNLARPGHADYTAHCKYHGFEDYRGGGHFSGRLTAAITAAGAIAITALKSKGIKIGTHIKCCGEVPDRKFNDIENDIESLSSMQFAVLDNDAGKKMIEEIEKAAEDGDSVGGILETAVCGMPAGIGEPWFDTLEGILSHAIFSIPGIKGIQFGEGFDAVNLRGSSFNDCFNIRNGRIETLTNNNGGINGGISNGMPIIFSCAVKPTSSISKTQKTVDFIKNETAEISTEGRHDPAFIHRARVVVDSITALVLCDILAQRFGTDYLRGEML